MEIKRIGQLNLHHHWTRSNDLTPDDSYRVDRGLVEQTRRLHLAYPFFDEIKAISAQNADRPVRILESGCGIGQSLRDLREGIQFPDNLDWPSVRPEVLEWRRSQHGKKYAGLGGQIITTGVTLTLEHAQATQYLFGEEAVDRVLVGPIEQWETDEKFDYILDLFGPFLASSDRVIEKYGQLLTSGGQMLVRAKLQKPTDLLRHLDQIEDQEMVIHQVGLPAYWGTGKHAAFGDFLATKI